LQGELGNELPAPGQALTLQKRTTSFRGVRRDAKKQFSVRLLGEFYLHQSTYINVLKDISPDFLHGIDAIVVSNE
jgi:hypothetical protein